jgi:hypothetical protein
MSRKKKKRQTEQAPIGTTHKEQKYDETKVIDSHSNHEKEQRGQIVKPTSSPDKDKLLIMPKGDWYAVAEAVVGLAHRRIDPPLPCQDAFCISTKPRTTLLVADGAGSAAVSEIGANAVVYSCLRLLDTLNDQVSELLDNEFEPEFETKKSFALRLVKHAKGTLEDKAKQYRREIRDFRCTLLALVIGKERLLWIKVGDGALVIEDKGELKTLGEVGKGEFANQTTFIDDKLMPDLVQFGIISSIYVSGLAAMSDGAADRLVANDGSKVAGRVAEFFNLLRKNSLNRTQITIAFRGEAVKRDR